MKKISLWAKRHKNAARILLVVLKILLVFMGCYIGDRFYQMHLQLPVSILSIASVVIIFAVVLYPAKKSAYSKNKFYIIQKSCDFILAACTFLAIVTFVNNRESFRPPMQEMLYGSFIKKHAGTAQEILASLKYREAKTLTHAEKRVLKKELKRQLKIYALNKVTGDKEGSKSALLIILTIIGAIGVLALVSALACGIACNGSEGLAIAVFILGLAGVIFLAARIIRGIPKKPKETQASPNS